MTQDDHDLLIAINTKLDLMLSQAQDHEKRLRRLEYWGFAGLGVLGFIELAALVLRVR